MALGRRLEKEVEEARAAQLAKENNITAMFLKYLRSGSNKYANSYTLHGLRTVTKRKVGRGPEPASPRNPSNSQTVASRTQRFEKLSEAIGQFTKRGVCADSYLVMRSLVLVTCDRIEETQVFRPVHRSQESTEAQYRILR